MSADAVRPAKRFSGEWTSPEGDLGVNFGGGRCPCERVPPPACLGFLSRSTGPSEEKLVDYFPMLC